LALTGALLPINIQLALAPVIEGQSHLKRLCAFIIPHYNRVLGEAEYYWPVRIFGF
jgi:hypothetical protein